MIEKTRPRIRVLDAHVANKIAAGEVVERPASVVKELVENALDAHATRIEVHVEQGGKRFVRVVDDGWGMGPEDLARVFLPHATSKLSDVEDLLGIATLGFRGEALASIGAVSHARVLSRAAGEPGGHAVENRGGEIRPVRAAAAAPGTDVSVRNLFFNTPARARFLRTERTELGHIEELVRRFALAFPETGFRLVHDGRELVRTSPGEARDARLERLYGRELAGALLRFEGGGPELRVEGFLSPPAVSRPNARELHFFVNGRAIRDRILHRVVRDAYRDLLHGGRFPAVFLFLEIDPGRVDVNVHPTKAEVRWRDPSLLHRCVAPLLARTLRHAGFRAEPGGEAAGGPADAGREEGIREAMADFLRRAQSGGSGADRIREPAPGAGAARGAQPGPRATPFSVFQVHDAYLVCEVEDGLAIVDQHALHERVCYDRIVQRLGRGGGQVEAQRLLVPEQVELASGDSGLLDEHADLLRRCGFEWSRFGPRTVALEAIPAALPRERAAEVARDLVELFRTRGREVDPRTLFHDVADTLACKAAVRFGDRMSREEAQALLVESGALERDFVCPHGRPAVLRLRFADLERHFGRR